MSVSLKYHTNAETIYYQTKYFEKDTTMERKLKH